MRGKPITRAVEAPFVAAVCGIRSAAARGRPAAPGADRAYLCRRRPSLLVPVRDPAAIEVVRRELDLHPVAREDADVVAPHLARDVPEHLVVVVELDAEHRVGKGLRDLPLHLDLLFLRHAESLSAAPVATRGGRGQSL